jgi:hypothetical protein
VANDDFHKSIIRSMRTFDNEWIFQAFEGYPSFLTKRMFGGLAVYLFGRMMMVLVEPTRTIVRDDQRFGIRPRPRK